MKKIVILLESVVILKRIFTNSPDGNQIFILLLVHIDVLYIIYDLQCIETVKWSKVALWAQADVWLQQRYSAAPFPENCVRVLERVRRPRQLQIYELSLDFFAAVQREEREHCC